MSCPHGLKSMPCLTLETQFGKKVSNGHILRMNILCNCVPYFMALSGKLYIFHTSSLACFPTKKEKTKYLSTSFILFQVLKAPSNFLFNLSLLLKSISPRVILLSFRSIRIFLCFSPPTPVFLPCETLKFVMQLYFRICFLSSSSICAIICY